MKGLLSLKKRIGLESTIHSNLISIGIIHHQQLNYGKALKYYEQSLEIMKKYDFYTGDLLGLIGGAYYSLGQDAKSEEYFAQFLELTKTQNNWQAKLYVSTTKGSILHEKKQYNDALKHFLVAHDIAEKIKVCVM